MPRTSKAQREHNRAQEFRDKLEQLLAEVPYRYLGGWFIDWAESELRRNRFYRYSEKEYAVLDRQLLRLRPITGFGDYTVDELIDIVAKYRADCSEDDEDLVGELIRERPSGLPLWLVFRLVSICRHVACVPIPYIEDLELAVSEAGSGEAALP